MSYILASVHRIIRTISFAAYASLFLDCIDNIIKKSVYPAVYCSENKSASCRLVSIQCGLLRISVKGSFVAIFGQYSPASAVFLNVSALFTNMRRLCFLHISLKLTLQVQ